MDGNIGNGRRQALLGLGAAGAAALVAVQARAAGQGPMPQGSSTLAALGKRLADVPRRRAFKTVPMILESRDQWDADALDAVIAYAGEPKQVWDNTDIASPWLNLMRNSLNAQVYSFRHPDFLAVSATHGSAHFALYDQAMWDKYKLAALAGHGIGRNTFIVPTGAPSADADHEDPDSAFGPSHGDAIPTLQERGVVFLACHNAIWEQAGKLRETGVNPDKLSQPALAAELTNHLIDGVVLTPGAVGTLPELQRAGFGYAK